MYKNGLEKVIEKTLELESQADNKLIIEENMEAILLGHFPDCDSKTIISQLMAGDASVKKQLDTKEAIDYEAMSEEALEDAFRTRAESFNSMIDMVKENEQYDIGTSWEHIDVNMPATIEKMRELDENFDLLLDAVTPLMFDDGESAQMLDENAAVMENLDDSHRYYLELALYILVRQGEIQEIPEMSGGAENQTPFAIGAVASSVFEAIKVKLAGIKGKITWNNVKSALKKIGKGLIDILIAMGLGYLICALFGPAVAVFVGKVLTLFWVFAEIGLLMDWVESGKAGEFWEKVQKKVKNIVADTADKMIKAGQVLNLWYKELISWIKEKAHNIKETSENKLDNFIQTYKTKPSDDDDDDDEKNYEFSGHFQNQPAF
jgi:hypothetical protein